MSQDEESTSTGADNQILQSGWASQVDAQTAQQFTGLTRIRQARVNQLQREATLLTRIYGANDPGVLSVQASLANERAYAAKLGVARDSTSATAPTAPAGGWVVYGHVRNADLTPAAKYTVFLADKSRGWLTQYGYAFTSQSGYYALSYTPNAPSTKSVHKQAAAAASLSAYVEVSDPACKLVYSDTAPMSIPVGAAINRDIVLAGYTSIGTPPCKEGAPPSVPPGKK